MSAPPPLAELLPHAAPMLLLDRVVAHDAGSTTCLALPEASALFRDAAGRVPAWVGIEYMAQCAAAHGGLLARARGEPPRPGLFVGSRHLELRCDAFAADAPLRVSARHVAGRGSRLAFACAVEDPAGGPPLLEGRLNVLLLGAPPDEGGG